MRIRFDSQRVRIYLGVALFLLGYGFFQLIYFAFAHPPGGHLDRAMLWHVAVGVFYVFCAFWVWLSQPSFAWLLALFFLVFILELSHVGLY